MSSHVQLLQDLYASFQAGDIEPLINAMHEDVKWEMHDVDRDLVPFGGHPYVGKEGVREFFKDMDSFMKVNPGFDIATFTFYGKGDTIVVTGDWACHVKHTGKSYNSVWAQVWRFRDNQVVSWDKYCNNYDDMVAAFS